MELEQPQGGTGTGKPGGKNRDREIEGNWNRENREVRE